MQDVSALDARDSLQDRRPMRTMIATHGTQDVNDPERHSGRSAGPEAGSFTSWVPFLRWWEPR